MLSKTSFNCNLIACSNILEYKIIYLLSQCFIVKSDKFIAFSATKVGLIKVYCGIGMCVFLTGNCLMKSVGATETPFKILKGPWPLVPTPMSCKRFVLEIEYIHLYHT